MSEYLSPGYDGKIAAIQVLFRNRKRFPLNSNAFFEKLLLVLIHAVHRYLIKELLVVKLLALGFLSMLFSEPLKFQLVTDEAYLVEICHLIQMFVKVHLKTI